MYLTCVWTVAFPQAKEEIELAYAAGHVCLHQDDYHRILALIPVLLTFFTTSVISNSPHKGLTK